jgi:hypothetical protein
MPVRDGRPNGPCAAKKNDKCVRLSQGDLTLCDCCERFRFLELGVATSFENKTVGTVGMQSRLRMAIKHAITVHDDQLMIDGSVVFSLSH